MYAVGNLVEGLRHKLRMFGVPINGTANALSDDMAVIENSTIPSSTVKKKHNSILNAITGFIMQ
jgi:hypothetical protein